MQKTKCILTVFFEDPFWVGVYERVTGDTLEVCKITFGAEPKDYDVYSFLLENWHLLRFSLPVPYTVRTCATLNPKRMQRAIQRQMNRQGVGTKSQQALKLQQAENKAERRESTRAQRDAERERQFTQKQQKRREKHRGR